VREGLSLDRAVEWQTGIAAHVQAATPQIRRYASLPGRSLLEVAERSRPDRARVGCVARTSVAPARHTCRVECLATRSKQRIGAHSTRHVCRGPANVSNQRSGRLGAKAGADKASTPCPGAAGPATHMPLALYWLRSGMLDARGGAGIDFRNAKMSVRSWSETTFSVYGGICPVGWRT
jgi:hypothetical protein